MPRDRSSIRIMIMSRRSSISAVFLWPTTAILLILALVPTLYAILIALQNRDLSAPTYSYVWFANFIDLFADRRFLNALWVSVKWEVVTVAGTMLVAIGLGIMMFEHAGPRFRNLLCLLFIVPVLLPRVSAAFVWKFAFHPLYGVITYPYRAITGTPFDALSNASTALYAVAAVDIWQWGLFFAVIIVKLLEALPRQPLEAARLDYANTWQVHWFITLPMLKAALVSLLFVKMIESLRSFDLIYVMTRGGPGIATETLDMYAFSQGFIESGRVSYASAMAVLMLVLTNLTFTILWKRLQR
jgi:multiple sugar transport system permease protein